MIERNKIEDESLLIIKKLWKDIKIEKPPLGALVLIFYIIGENKYSISIARRYLKDDENVESESIFQLCDDEQADAIDILVIEKWLLASDLDETLK